MLSENFFIRFTKPSLRFISVHYSSNHNFEIKFSEIREQKLKQKLFCCQLKVCETQHINCKAKIESKFDFVSSNFKASIQNFFFPKNYDFKSSVLKAFFLLAENWASYHCQLGLLVNECKS